MVYRYSDYSGNDDTPSLPLLVSERTQQLVLAVLKSVESQYAWIGNFDDIDAMVSDALTEIIEVAMPDFTPVGMIMPFAGNVASIPDKWLPCDGRTLSDLDYPDLAAIFAGTPYTGHPNFTIPDLRSQFVLGAATITNGEIGDIGGEETHTLTIAEMPAHTHVQKGRNNSGGAVFQTAISTSAQNLATFDTLTVTGSTGGNEAHNNMPPYTKFFYLIKVLP